MCELNQAVEAVRHLNIDNFIKEQEATIFEKIEDSYKRVESGPRGSMMFVEQCLPLASGIINVGSTSEDYRLAKAWLAEELPKVDPILILPALTLMYVVNKGREYFASNPEKAGIWGKMAMAMDTLVG
jgi:hypothetical protein